MPAAHGSRRSAPHGPRSRRGVKPWTALLACCLFALALTACAVGEPLPTTNVGDTGARLNGNVYSNFEGDTDYWWEYGETTAYGSETPRGTIAISDEDPHPVTEAITGLTPSTTYHFQLCVQDDEESPPRDICSSDQTFTTAPPADGSRLAFTSDRDGNNEIYVMDTFGYGLANVTNNPASDYNPAWSPDRSKIAFTSDRDGNNEIYVMDADGGNPTRLTNDPASDDEPDWSPDGTQIAFSSDRDDDGDNEIYVMEADGDNPTALTDNVDFDGSPKWSPDGTEIAFISDRDGDFFEIYVMAATGAGATRLTNNPGEDYLGDWSPDGTQIAFTTRRDGNSEVYVMDAGGANPTNLSNHPAEDGEPTWSPGGDKLAFHNYRDHPDQEKIEVYTMDADGGNQTRLTFAVGADDELPDWSTAP